ncbi:hypothetical protein EPR50_G00109200 [Perca flavescens]|uniref:Immunoresponsive gene 1, like n=1 Tax=Perca flavescens TaxID=8167 RepID=A0A484CYJ4_PERFV|nr:hypothetical protein EPR50_G00109200 [Perca flavescens]
MSQWFTGASKYTLYSVLQKTIRPVWAVRGLHKSAVEVLRHPAPEDTVTASFGKFISEVKPQHLSSVVLHRSKRMVLDSIGVGVIGSTTDVFELALQHCQNDLTIVDPAEKLLFTKKVLEFGWTVQCLLCSEPDRHPPLLEKLAIQQQWLAERPWVSHFVPQLEEFKRVLERFLQATPSDPPTTSLSPPQSANIACSIGQPAPLLASPELSLDCSDATRSAYAPNHQQSYEGTRLALFTGTRGGRGRRKGRRGSQRLVPNQPLIGPEPKLPSGPEPDLTWHMYAPDDISSVYGRRGTRLSPTLAAFVNGVATHSMDFDDTWHPATHPSGAVLPAVLALSDMMSANSKPSGLDFLLAFNIGIEIQGRLMRFSNEAHNIPKRFHPPSVVGTMGSAAACARLLSLDPSQCSHALAIATSLSGAPMANAATQSKPLHIGNASRLGLEAALLASRGLEASSLVLDAVTGVAGFNAFYEDYVPQPLELSNDDGHMFLLEEQDMGFKRFPAHLGMHWVADAAASVHKILVGFGPGTVSPAQVQDILLRVPKSKYINRPFPDSEHEARHSFQFNACSALLDGEVTVQSFTPAAIRRPDLLALLSRVRMEHPQDNPANFNSMYGEVQVTLVGGDILKGRQTLSTVTGATR